MQELAWASYTLSRNMPAACVVLCSASKVWMARGQFGLDLPSDTGQALALLGQVTAGSSSEAALLSCRNQCSLSLGLQEALKLTSTLMTQQVLDGRAPSAYFPDRGALSEAGLLASQLLPASCQCACLHPVSIGAEQRVVLLVAAPAARALAPRDRGWAGAVADKLSRHKST